jgi:hypothetical protein
MENHETPRKSRNEAVTPLFAHIQSECAKHRISIAELLREVNKNGVVCDRSTLTLWRNKLPKSIAALYAIMAEFERLNGIAAAQKAQSVQNAGNHRELHNETPALE